MNSYRADLDAAARLDQSRHAAMLHVDKVPHWRSLCSLAALCHFLSGSFHVPLLLPFVALLLVLDGLGAAVGVAIVVEEAPEGELVKGVLWVLAVAEPAAECVVVAVAVTVCPVAIVAAPKLLRVHRVKVGRVGAVCDLGHVRRWLLPQVRGEVHRAEEGLCLDLVSAILAQPVLGPTAQLNDDVRGLGTQFGLRGDV